MNMEKRKMQHYSVNLEQVENLLAEVQFKVCVVGSCHVVDEHQAVPLGLKAERSQTEVDIFCFLLKGYILLKESGSRKEGLTYLRRNGRCCGDPRGNVPVPRNGGNKTGNI